jgi:sugar lactone lactonase YvrE
MTEILDDSTIANGLAFDATGRAMYWVDGGRRQIFRFDYSDDGAATNRRVFQADGTAPGRPDGGAVDAEGCYWSARWMGGCVARFTPDGRLDRLIEVPASRVTMCAFGGADYRTLFITTAHEGMSAEERVAEPHAGDIFAIELDVAGLLEPLFEG